MCEATNSKQKHHAHVDFALSKHAFLSLISLFLLSLIDDQSIGHALLRGHVLKRFDRRRREESMPALNPF